jgi:hypothetical protein
MSFVCVDTTETPSARGPPRLEFHVAVVYIRQSYGGCSTNDANAITKPSWHRRRFGFLLCVSVPKLTNHGSSTEAMANTKPRWRHGRFGGSEICHSFQLVSKQTNLGSSSAEEASDERSGKNESISEQGIVLQFF